MSIGAASSCIYRPEVPGTCHDATNEEPGYCGSSDPGEHHAHHDDTCPEEGFSCSGRCDASYTCCDSGVCAPTPSCGQLNEYWCGLLAAANISDRDAAEVSHGVGCRDSVCHGEWYFHGSTTSIGTGQSGAACNSSLVACAGGDVFGYGPAQAALVASFIQEWHVLNNGTLPPTPECPAAGDMLEPGDVSTASCAPGYTLCANCGYKCLSSAEHCPNVSRHPPVRHHTTSRPLLTLFSVHSVLRHLFCHRSLSSRETFRPRALVKRAYSGARVICRHRSQRRNRRATKTRKHGQATRAAHASDSVRARP